MHHTPLHAIQRRRARIIVGHLHIAETVQRKARLPFLDSISSERINVRLPRAMMYAPVAAGPLPVRLLRIGRVAQIAARVQRPVCVQTGPVPQRNRRARRPSHPQSAPSRDHLPQVEDVHALARAGHLNRPYRLDHPRRWHALRHHRAPGRLHSRSWLPRRVVVTGAVPTRSLQSRIVTLTVVEIVIRDRARRRFPFAVGDDADLPPVCVLNDRLQQQSGPVPVRRAVAGRRRNVILRAVPAMAQHDAENIGARPQQLRDIVAHIEHPRTQSNRPVVVVIRIPGVQHALSNLGAVHIQFPITQPRHVDRRPPHRPVHRKRPSQQRRRNLPVRRANPTSQPVAGLQQPHAEHRRRAESAASSLPVPHPHRPPAALIADEPRTVIFHVRHVCRFHPAAVPLVTDPGQQFSLAAGDQNPVGRLPLTARLRMQQPAEARLPRVDAHRIHDIFTL